MKRKLLILMMLAVLLLTAMPSVSLAAAKTPAIKKVTPTDASASVSWDAVEGAKGYEIRWGKTNTIGWTTKTTTSTNYTISGLKSNTKYTIQVRAYRKINSKTAYTSWSSKTYTTTKSSVSSIKLDAADIALQVGKTKQLTAMVSPTGAYGKITWSSSDPKVATVSSSGLVTAKKAGTATVTVKTGNGKTAKVKVTVTKAKPAVTGVKLDRETIEMLGKPVTLKAKCAPETADQTVTWSTSNQKVATVSSKGVVTPKGYGTCVITAKSKNGKVAKCTVMVQKKTYVTRSHVAVNCDEQISSSLLRPIWLLKPRFNTVTLFRIRITDKMTIIIDGLTGKVVKYQSGYDKACDSKVSKAGLADLYTWENKIEVTKITDTYVEFRAEHRVYYTVDIKKILGASIDIEDYSEFTYRLDHTGKLTVVSVRHND